MITLKESLNGLNLTEFMYNCSKDINTGFPFFCKNLLTLKRQPSWFHIEWVKAFESNARSLVEAPRQHGKTTILGAAYPLWKLFTAPGEDFLIVSHRMDHSTEILEEIKQFIYNSEVLHNRLVPEDRKAVWRKTQINVKPGGSVSCKPNTHAVCGGTYHKVLADEISLFKDHDVYFKDILPTVGTTQGHVMAIGTPKTGVDLLATIKEINEQKKSYWQHKYQIINKDYMTDANPKGILWPEMYPMTEIKKIKASMTSLDFEREYMCNIVDMKTQIFPTNQLYSCYDTKSFFERTPLDAIKYYAGSDLARSPDGDFNVHTVVRQNSKGIVTLAYMERHPGMDVDARALQMKDIFDRFRPVRYLADESLDGKAVIDVLRQDHLVPVEGFVFTPPERYAIITNLIKLVERNKLKIPSMEGDYHTAEMVQKLTKEMVDMVREVTPSGQPTYVSLGKHDDMVMSLALACQACSGFGNIGGGISDYFISNPDQIPEREEVNTSYFA